MNKHIGGRVTKLVFSLFIAACAVAGGACDVSSAADDAAPVAQTVTNVRPKGDVPLVAHETLRLGVADGNRPDLFSHISKVQFDSTGSIYVANNGTASVRIFDRTGQFDREIGSAGEGPSQFRQVNDLTIAGDTIVIIDWQGRGKIALFHRSGPFISSWPIHVEKKPTFIPIARSDKGWLWAAPPSSTPHVKGGDSTQIYARVLLKGFAPTDSGAVLYTYPAATLYGTGEPGTEGGVDWGLYRHSRFGAFDRAGHLFLTAPASYSIDVMDGLQRTLTATLDIAPRKVEKQDIDAIVDETSAIVDTLTGLDSKARATEHAGIKSRIQAQQHLPIPGVLGPIANLLVSPDGSFWVERADWQNPAKAEAAKFYRHMPFPSAPTVWDYFDKAGAYVGTVQLPARFRAEAANGKSIVGVSADSANVEYVVRYEIGK